MKSIILFASGRGSNVEAVLQYFEQRPGLLHVALIVCNNPGAGVIDIAHAHHIPLLMLSRESMRQDDWINEVAAYRPDLIVLAGFLRKIPERLVRQFENRIINIHPALLPAYGGKGMYGMKVHQTVIASGEKESGITIHYVNEHYDEGNIILQARCRINTGDTPELLVEKIHRLEHFYFPRTIEFLLQTTQDNQP